MGVSKYAKIRRLDKRKKPRRGAKGNYFGIEIEFFAPEMKFRNISNLLVEHKLDCFCTLQHDGSIRPDHHHEAAEITIIASDIKYKRVMKRVIDVLNEIDAKVNNSCGLHVHIDMRHRNKDKAVANLTQAQEILYSMMPENRCNNMYCARLPAVRDVDQATNARSYRPSLSQRYFGINTKALWKYNTLECRIHDGTVDYNEIINWITLLAKIADTETTETLTGNLKDLRLKWGVTKAIEAYIRRRITANHPTHPILAGSLNTIEFDDIEIEVEEDDEIEEEEECEDA